MATLRMIQVEVEAAPDTCVEILRRVLAGEDHAKVDRVEMTPEALREPAAIPEQPGPALSGRRENGAQGEPATGTENRPHATPRRPLKAGKTDGAAELPSKTQAGPTERILALLAKRPMSSSELIDALKCEPHYVYSNCSAMKNKGHIENVIDDDPASDGVRRYRIVKGNQ